jgi:hypothetical protein
MRFTTDPRQARKVQMKDGTVYPVSRDGHFVVTREDHLSEMNRGNQEAYGSATTFGGGVLCGCGRSPWPWERECPKCGALLPSS